MRLKLANRKVVAFFVLLKFGDSTESSLTVLASKSLRRNSVPPAQDFSNSLGLTLCPRTIFFRLCLKAVWIWRLCLETV